MTSVNKTILVKCGNSATTEIPVECFTQTVSCLKQKINEVLSVPECQQRLIYRGKVLKDENSLEFYEICCGQTVHLVKGTSKTESTPSQNSNSAPIAQQIPSSGSPFGGLGAFGNAGFGAGADMNRMQDQLLQNPEMMQQILNSPMMESLFSNPDILRDMLASNPQLQSLMDSNPQIRHMLNDPSVSILIFLLY
jgi:ubiquilin